MATKLTSYADDVEYYMNRLISAGHDTGLTVALLHYYFRALYEFDNSPAEAWWYACCEWDV